MNWVAIAKIAAQVIPPAVELIRRLKKGQGKMSFLAGLWDKVTSKLQGFGKFLPLIASQIKVAIDDQDVEKINAHLDQFDEMLEQGAVLSRAIRDAAADGELTATEAGPILLELEKFIDEAEDIGDGKDD